MRDWTTSPTHRRWLERHGTELLTFGRLTGRADGGAAWLDDDGRPDLDAPTYTYISARMLHVYGIGSLLGVPGSGPVAARALAGLRGRLRDADAGGWHHAVDATGGPVAGGKSCYDHAFVLLGASTAVEAGLPGARELLAEAEAVFLERFWDEDAGLCRDGWDAGFRNPDPYRGLNSNMHAVEALLSVASATGDRAVRVCSFVARGAAEHEWRIPEHYDADWRPILDYNRDRPDDQFKPYGSTVGHGLEWSRLFLHAEAAGSAAGGEWLRDGAAALFDRAVADGWNADGGTGFVYTCDWDGTPVVRDRLHWVLAEAINAAAALHRRTGDDRFAAAYREWWDHADERFLDHERGSWVHQLSPDNLPDDSVWAGKPDLYHAFQTTVVPRVPLYPMLATAVASGLIE